MEKFFASIRKNNKREETVAGGELYLVAGLGNPGREYRESRHNFGFMVIDELAKSLNVEFKSGQFKALTTTGSLNGSRILLVKPQTYMNLSGEAVVPLLHYYRIPETRLLVINDDMDLPFGTLRMRPAGGCGGQKGMGSIIDQLGNQNFARLRCGTGHPPGQMEVKNYVLNKFSDDEAKMLPEILSRAVDAVKDFVCEGLQYTMTHYNGSVEN